MLRIGLALTIAGLALLSPLGDLLPFDFWLNLKSLLVYGVVLDEHTLYRFVPGEPSRIIELVLITIGLVLMGTALLFRRRK